MAAELPPIRRWLLDEARALQQQQDGLRVRLEAVRSIMRLVKAYETATEAKPPEASS
jgi:hypothetical protein